VHKLLNQDISLSTRSQEDKKKNDSIFFPPPCINHIEKKTLCPHLKVDTENSQSSHQNGEDKEDHNVLEGKSFLKKFLCKHLEVSKTFITCDDNDKIKVPMGILSGLIIYQKTHRLTMVVVY
jgi:hypothetical protein